MSQNIGTCCFVILKWRFISLSLDSATYLRERQTVLYWYCILCYVIYVNTFNSAEYTSIENRMSPPFVECAYSNRLVSCKVTSVVYEKLLDLYQRLYLKMLRHVVGKKNYKHCNLPKWSHITTSSNFYWCNSLSTERLHSHDLGY